MGAARITETILVVSLFAGYVALWRFKRTRDMRETGIDPEVLALATSPVQAHFARLVWFFTTAATAMIILHAVAPADWPPFTRVPALDTTAVDVGGAVIGIAGLTLCYLAQVAMGKSWRVGIDRERPTDLVTQGPFRLIRNPTYLGLHLLDFGVWLIWPTTIVAGYAILFFMVMDIQVRAEEEHLVAIHGRGYEAYAARTWRYVPWLY